MPTAREERVQPHDGEAADQPADEPRASTATGTVASDGPTGARGQQSRGQSADRHERALGERRQPAARRPARPVADRARYSHAPTRRLCDQPGAIRGTRRQARTDPAARCGRRASAGLVGCVREARPGSGRPQRSFRLSARTRPRRRKREQHHQDGADLAVDGPRPWPEISAAGDPRLDHPSAQGQRRRPRWAKRNRPPAPRTSPLTPNSMPVVGENGPLGRRRSRSRPRPRRRAQTRGRRSGRTERRPRMRPRRPGRSPGAPGRIGCDRPRTRPGAPARLRARSRRAIAAGTSRRRR